MKFGIYRLHEPIKEDDLVSLENAYGTSIQIISVYRAWNHCSINNDLQWLNLLKTSSRQILITWEPWQLSSTTDQPYDQPAFSLKNILSGGYDDYIRSFVRELETFPRTVLLRVMHEMNGNWYPWGGTVNGNSPEEFVDAWNYIRNITNSEAPSNIQWVWSPYAHSHPHTANNKIENYFPGDEFIDLSAIDGYNWGEVMTWSKWQSVEDIFSDAYQTITHLSKRPLIIGEVASTEIGGHKDFWIIDTMETIRQRFPRIEALIWFDVQKESDWRINSSPSALEAFRSCAKIFDRIC